MFTHNNTLKPTLLAASIFSVLGMSQTASAVEPMITANYYHSYGLRNDGTLFCFGACAGHFSPVTVTNGAIAPEAAILNEVQMLTEPPGSTAMAALLNGGSVKYWIDDAVWTQTATIINTLSGLADLTSITYDRGSFLGVKQDGNVISFGGWNNEPVTPFSGLSNVERIIGDDPSIAITTDNKVFTFLKNDWGGEDTPPAEVIGFNNVNVKDIAYAYMTPDGVSMHVALLEDGTVMEWAIESVYEADTLNFVSHTPVQLTLPSVKAIHQGARKYTTDKAYAITETGDVYCWGDCDNEWNTPAHSTPTQVSGISTAKSVMVGRWPSNDTLAVTEEGNVFVWGGDLIATQVPIANVITASNGPEHTLVMQQDGTLCGWGDNSYGQLGANNPNPIPISAPVCGLEDLIIPLETDTGDCAPAEFSLVNNTLTLPTLALEVFSPAETQPSGEYMVVTGLEGTPITLKLRGVNDFLLSKSFKYELTGEVLTSADTCHPSFSMTDRLMQVPYVEVSAVTVTPATKLIESEGLQDCYATELKQSVLLPHIFELDTITPVECQ